MLSCCRLVSPLRRVDPQLTMYHITLSFCMLLPPTSSIIVPHSLHALLHFQRLSHTTLEFDNIACPPNTIPHRRHMIVNPLDCTLVILQCVNTYLHPARLGRPATALLGQSHARVVLRIVSPSHRASLICYTIVSSLRRAERYIAPLCAALRPLSANAIASPPNVVSETVPFEYPRSYTQGSKNVINSVQHPHPRRKKTLV
ncbi:uncharacterized protein EV420DRAFT_1768266 [Desarmillaria tabescens]|uniref:Uncharacterized protein n=1 Tax=Armillaria tabescens TaxID=1929756 RepID=A0AA39MSJ5_ARMTA|nr:uncharacterized protein EV420DRAFT_1768266 [Desarmillaria tabescens]KAK0444663.1 hypothetical protein EV420DRAFT_1768266 [Desarmillaria tabescens]